MMIIVNIYCRELIFGCKKQCKALPLKSSSSSSSSHQKEKKWNFSTYVMLLTITRPFNWLIEQKPFSFKHRIQSWIYVFYHFKQETRISVDVDVDVNYWLWYHFAINFIFFTLNADDALNALTLVCLHIMYFRAFSSNSPIFRFRV